MYKFQHEILEELRRERIDELATMIQKIFRGFTCRLKIRKLQESQMVIATCWKKWKDKSHISEIKQRRHEEWATLIVQKCFKGWQVSFHVSFTFLVLLFWTFLVLLLLAVKRDRRTTKLDLKYPEKGLKK